MLNCLTVVKSLCFHFSSVKWKVSVHTHTHTHSKIKSQRTHTHTHTHILILIIRLRAKYKKFAVWRVLYSGQFASNSVQQAFNKQSLSPRNCQMHEIQDEWFGLHLNGRIRIKKKKKKKVPAFEELTLQRVRQLTHMNQNYKTWSVWYQERGEFTCDGHTRRKNRRRLTSSS